MGDDTYRRQEIATLFAEKVRSQFSDRVRLEHFGQAIRDSLLTSFLVDLCKAQGLEPPHPSIYNSIVRPDGVVDVWLNWPLDHIEISIGVYSPPSKD
jgi:hypothetical protein